MSQSFSYRLVWGQEEFDLPPGEITLGRSRSCDVSVSDPSVSRRHVFLRMESGSVVLQDLGSSNGTFVDGGRVRGTATIGDGAELRLGDARLFLRVDELEAGAPRPQLRPLTPQASVADGAPPLAEPPQEIPETERETSKLVDGDDSGGYRERVADAQRAQRAGEGRVPAAGRTPEAERTLKVASFEEPDSSPVGLEAPEEGSSPILGWAAWGGAAFLGMVLLVAAWVKAIDPTSFANQIAREGLDFVLPASTVALIGIGIEILLGTLLVLGVRRLPVLLASTGLVGFFVILTGRTWWLASRGDLPADVGCGCFGNLVQRTPAEAFWQDLLLLVPALAIAWLARPREGGVPRWRTALALMVTVAGLLLAFKAPDLPLDDLATRLRPDVRIDTLCAGQDGARTCLDGVAPELREGEHLVVLAQLDEAFSEAVSSLDEYHLADRQPPLMVLAAVTPEELFAFRFGQGAAFEIHEAPEPVLRPLYRTLPRSFRVVDGQVVETWNGFAPELGVTP